jgi:SHS2 domain-containing protein
MPGSHDYFEHGADIGVIGRGASVEEAFAQAACAMFAIMVDREAVRPTLTVEVEFDESDRELALVRWLNALLAAAREHGAILAQFQVHQEGDRWRGLGRGERWREALARGTEVKGATLTALAVRPLDGGWEARCVVDV